MTTAADKSHVLTTRPLADAGVGAEIVGADLVALSTPVAAQALRMLLVERGVLLVRGQDVSREALERLAAALGTVETVRPAAERLQGSELLRVQSNLPGVGVDGGGMYWHADGSWMPRPTAATVLACVQAPATSGTTTFVDARAFYCGLNAKLRTAVADALGCFANERTLLGDFPAMRTTDPQMLATAVDVTHPLVRRHPITGDEALVLDEKWLSEIVGLSAAASAELLAELARAADACTARYDHTWAFSDVLLWDNRLVLHRAQPLKPSGRKVTWRATIRTLHGEEHSSST